VITAAVAAHRSEQRRSCRYDHHRRSVDGAHGRCDATTCLLRLRSCRPRCRRRRRQSADATVWTGNLVRRRFHGRQQHRDRGARRVMAPASASSSLCPPRRGCCRSGSSRIRQGARQWRRPVLSTGLDSVGALDLRRPEPSTRTSPKPSMQMGADATATHVSLEILRVTDGPQLDGPPSPT
jgi:hypothetical protein